MIYWKPQENHKQAKGGTSMELSIVYDSRTGNTAFLARELARAFPAVDCRRLEEAEGPLARRVCLGFWTDKGTCSEAVRAFLPALAGRRIFLFGTAGFGLSQAYFAQIIQRVAAQLPADARMEEWFMCQGRMGGRRSAALRGHVGRSRRGGEGPPAAGEFPQCGEPSGPRRRGGSGGEGPPVDGALDSFGQVSDFWALI